MLALFDDWSLRTDAPHLVPADQSNLTWQDEDGPLSIHRIVADGAVRYRLNLGDDIAVELGSGRQLSARIRPDLSPDTLDHFLADQVIPRALAGEGRLVIHAGGIAHRDGAILLLGASGRGKSTLTTSFFVAGHVMLGDDAMVIDDTATKPAARAVYPSLRLLPDSIAALVPGRFDSNPVADYSAKRRIEIPIAGPDTVASAPIAAIVVLGLPTQGTITLRRLSVAQSCMAVVENSFALDPSDIGRASERLTQASALARAVPAFEIAYPRDYACLPAVRARIIEAVAQAAAGSEG